MVGPNNVQKYYAKVVGQRNPWSDDEEPATRDRRGFCAEENSEAPGQARSQNRSAASVVVGGKGDRMICLENELTSGESLESDASISSMASDEVM